MKARALAIVIAIVLFAIAVYALDRGIYVGSARYVMGYEADFPQDSDFLQKRCRYLFITGISEIDAHEGRVAAPHARSYCRLFAH